MNKNKNSSNLIRTDTFLYTIKMFFINLFFNKSNKKENASNASFVQNIENIEMNGKSKFLEQIKIETENKNEKLVRLLKNKSISIEELTEEQKEEIKLFLQKKIAEKRLKLQNIKNKKLLKELNNNDIDLILSRTSTDEKTNFIEYLKEEINIKKDKLKKLKTSSI